MAERRVSVRFSAEGVRSVTEAFREIGEAGSDGPEAVEEATRRANERLDAFARSARRTVGLLAAAAAAAAVTATAAITRAVAENAEEIRRASQVANSTPEAFQRFAQASRTVGIEQDKLADILKDVNDRVGDFLSTGGGPMADFFEQIAPKVGVTAEQFRKLSGPEALQLYVSSLEAAGLSQQEMTFYLEAMASDVTALLPLLRNGGAEMTRLGDQAARLGAVIDTAGLAALNRMTAAMVVAEQATDGLSNRLAVAAAPAITAMAEAFVTLADEGGAINIVLTAVAENLDVLVTVVGVVVAALGLRLVAAAAQAAVALLNLVRAVGALRLALALMGGPIGVAVALATAAAGAFVLMRDRGDELDDTLFALKAGHDALNGALRTFFETAAPSSGAAAISYAQDLRQQAAAARDAAASEVALARARIETVRSRMDAGGALAFPAAARESIMQAQVENLAEAEAGLERAKAALAEAEVAANRAVTSVTGSMSEVMTAVAGEALKLDVAVTGLAETAAGAGGRVAAAVMEPIRQLPENPFGPVEDEVDEFADTVEQRIGQAFGRAADALAEFVQTGRLDFGRLVGSILADLARLQIQGGAARLAGTLGTMLAGALGGGPAAAPFNPRGLYHDGGMVGSPSGSRRVSDAVFAGARRYHDGGMVGLRPDEVPAILQRGERVLSRREVAQGGAVAVTYAPTIHAPGATVEAVAAIRQALEADRARLPAVIQATVTRAKKDRRL